MTDLDLSTSHIDRFVLDRLPPREQWPDLVYDRPEFQVPRLANAAGALLMAPIDAGRGDAPCLRGPDRTLTYAQVLDAVQRQASVLLNDFKLLPGERVLLRGGNGVDMALAWLAVVWAGGIAVATMPMLRAAELTRVIEKAQPRLALCEAKLRADLDAAQLQTGDVLKTIIDLGDASPEALGARAHDAPPSPTVITVADDPVLLAFTSGTTGQPKAVVHTHRDVLVACAAWPRSVLGMRADDIVAGSPPLAFTFGLGGLLVFPLAAGASIYFPEVPYTPELMVRLMAEHGVTVCYTAPTFYRQMAPFAKSMGLPALRASVSAGEALPDATRQLWRDATGLDMVDGIGATEMFHIFISSSGADIRAGAIGRVVPGYQAKVVDEHGAELPRGSVGRLAVKGPTGCRYMADERQTRYVQGGWNYPGDAFVQDADGYFFYQSRDDDMIITAGYNVGGPEVEDVLLRHPAVAECAVIGAPDDERGMVVKAVCVLRPGFVCDDALVKALQDHVKAQIAPYKYPRQIEFRHQLPRTETGKLQRFKLRQELKDENKERRS